MTELTYPLPIDSSELEDLLVYLGEDLQAAMEDYLGIDAGTKIW